MEKIKSKMEKKVFACEDGNCGMGSKSDGSMLGWEFDSEELRNDSRRFEVATSAVTASAFFLFAASEVGCFCPIF